MALLTIGAFARASRLTPKALRLYDQLGLLRPVKTDPGTGYRWYGPEQLGQARLVAWLRRIGMPLARIAIVRDLPPASVAAEVEAYWAQVEAETEARRELVAFLVEQLSRGEIDMSGDRTVPRVRWASYCDRGLVRERNQDALWTGDGLVGVADGFGPGTTADEMPSAAALGALAASIPAASVGALLDGLHAAAERAAEAVRTTTSDAAMRGAGTTLTALAWAGDELALVHVGDSRAYLLRDGELLRLTHDDSLVQRLIEEGKLTDAEAESHPQRAILVKALHAESDVPAVHGHRARPGDRYLLCTDGLHVPVAPELIQRALAEAAEPEAAVARLAELVREAGAPDNVAVVVADVLAERSVP